MLVSFLFLLFLCKSKEKIKIIFKSLICKLQGFFFLKYFFNTDYIKCIQNISQIFISLSGNHSKKIGTQEKGRKLYFCRHLAFNSIYQMSSKATKSRFSCYNNWSLTTAALVGNISGVEFQLVWNYFTAILLPLTFRCKVKP